MNENETTALVRAFDRAYINGKFVTPHGTQVVDLVNPTNNTVIGKVTMADEIDTRQAIAAAKEAFDTFSQSSKEYRIDCLQRLQVNASEVSQPSTWSGVRCTGGSASDPTYWPSVSVGGLKRS